MNQSTWKSWIGFSLVIQTSDIQGIVTGFLGTQSQFRTCLKDRSMIGSCQMFLKNCDGVFGNPITTYLIFLAGASQTLPTKHDLSIFAPFPWLKIVSLILSEYPLHEEAIVLVQNRLWKVLLHFRLKVLPHAADVKQHHLFFFIQLRQFLQGFDNHFFRDNHFLHNDNHSPHRIRKKSDYEITIISGITKLTLVSAMSFILLVLSLDTFLQKSCNPIRRGNSTKLTRGEFQLSKHKHKAKLSDLAVVTVLGDS